MILRFTAALLVMTAGCTGMVSAQRYQPAFRPDALGDRPAGRANEVLVVGSPHLSNFSAASRRGWLNRCSSAWLDGAQPLLQARTYPACNATPCVARAYGTRRRSRPIALTLPLPAVLSGST